MRKGGLHIDTERERVKPKPPGSEVSLQLPTKEQAASAESIPGLCTSGWACQSARQGVERGRVLAGREKGQPACPEAGCVQLSESLTPIRSTPTSLTQGANPRPVEEPRGGRVPPPCHSFRKRKTAWLEGKVFVSLNSDFPFSLYLSCRALRCLLLALSLLIQPLECGTGIYNLSSLQVIQHLNLYETFELYPQKDLFNKKAR